LQGSAQSLDQEHDQFETGKQDRAGDDLLSNEKRFHDRYLAERQSSKARASAVPGAMSRVRQELHNWSTIGLPPATDRIGIERTGFRITHLRVR
jgi:hypothetical protein